ncbi:MAG: SRPBCC family protein [Actinomycetota bacterium]
MNYYEFVTVWRFDAPVEKVWEAIKNSEMWSNWWKGVLKVEQLKAGNAEGVGKIIRSTWKSKLPYKLVFDSEVVRVEPMKTIEARAFGELDGTGLWTLTAEAENTTRVRYDWTVKTTKSWMNRIAPLAKPFFRWNHNVIMNWGGAGLAKKLNCRLLDSKEG